MSKHTPAPWFTEAVDNDFAETIRREALTASGCIMSGDGDIAYVAKRSTDESTEESEANAAHIVKCVNERDELVAALSAFDKWHEQLSARDWENGAIKDEWRVMKKRARAILAKVKS